MQSTCPENQDFGMDFLFIILYELCSASEGHPKPSADRRLQVVTADQPSVTAVAVSHSGRPQGRRHQAARHQRATPRLRSGQEEKAYARYSSLPVTSLTPHLSAVNAAPGSLQ